MQQRPINFEIPEGWLPNWLKSPDADGEVRPDGTDQQIAVARQGI